MIVRDLDTIRGELFNLEKELDWYVEQNKNTGRPIANLTQAIGQIKAARTFVKKEIFIKEEISQ